MNRAMMKDLMIYMPAKVIEGIMGIVMISLYSALLSTGQFGQYAVVNTSVSIAYMLTCGWLMHAAYRHINTLGPLSEKKAFVSTVSLTWFGIQVTSILVVYLLTFVLPALSQLLLMTILLFGPFSGMQLTTALLASKKRTKTSVLLTTSSVTLKVGLVALLFHLQQSLVTIMVIHALVDASLLCVVLVGLRVYRHVNLKAYDLGLIKNLAVFGFPLIGTALAMSVINMSDRYMIYYFKGESMAGIYTANYLIASATFSMLMIAMMRAVYPNILSTWKSNDLKSMQTSIWHGLRYFLMLAMPAALGLVLLSHEISSLIVAYDYRIGYSIIGWIAISLFFLGVAEYFIKPLELHKQTHVIFKGSFIAASINVVLNFIAIPQFGFIAAAVTTTIAYMVYAGFVYVKVQRAYGIISDPTTLFRIVLATTSMGAGVFLFRPIVTSWLSMAFVILGGVLVYLAVLIFSGELQHELKSLHKGRK